MNAADLFSYEDALAAKAAWYYYHEDLTQQQISELLGINRMRVMKLLDHAKESGIIRFNFRARDSRRMELEQSISKTYGLKDCFIVPTASNAQQLNRNVAKAAAQYIGSRIHSDTFINIGFGDTCSQVLDFLSAASEYTLSCVSLTGGVSYYLQNRHPGVYDSRLYLMPAPILASTPEVAEAMQGEKSVRQIQELIPLSSLTVVGIGAMDENATILTSGVLTSNDFLLLKRNGAVGDLLSHFINAEGEPVSSELESRLLSTPLSTLRELEQVIGVAAGRRKADAIRAVLLGHYLDVLITDEDTAALLVES